MIRWTLKKKGNAIALTFKERRRFWTRELLLALTIACIAHLIPIAVFKIDLGMLKNPAPIAPVTLLPSPPGSLLSAAKEIIKKIDMPFLETARPLPPTAFTQPHVQEIASYRAPVLTRKTYYAAPTLSRGIRLANQPSPPSMTGLEPLRAILTFEADPKTGTIYFFTWKERTGLPHLDKEIEHYLKQLILTIPPETLAHGEIDIQFRETPSS